MRKIIIAHRGNTNGSNPTEENSPNYIMAAIDKGFDVEVDVRFWGGKYFLGHNAPQYEIPVDFFTHRMWLHCKNIEALYKLSGIYNCFYHDIDDCVMTSKGYIWTYPGKTLTPMSIAVMPETVGKHYDTSIAAGICTDFI